ncbi:hypothetical protein J6590_010558 [Homalodisca vitripennis]|nr:hypothetical protein J6590_010558 [Homalodisca vitripennis]
MHNISLGNSPSKVAMSLIVMRGDAATANRDWLRCRPHTGLTSLVILPCPSKSYSVKENSCRSVGSAPPSTDTSHSNPWNTQKAVETSYYAGDQEFSAHLLRLGNTTRHHVTEDALDFIPS